MDTIDLDNTVIEIEKSVEEFFALSREDAFDALQDALDILKQIQNALIVLEDDELDKFDVEFIL